MLNDCFERSRGPVLFASCISLVALTGCTDRWQSWLPNGGDGDGNQGAAGSGEAGGSAGSAGESVDGGSSEQQQCGGRGLEDCPEGQFCQFPEAASCGETDAPGVCVAVPELCTRIYAPVCGCDGKTYGNACEASTGSVSVRAQGECPQACGGLQGAQCDEGEYCKYAIDAQCGAADQTGECTPIPEVCTLELNPVCGCDSRTYGNACAAAAAGVSVSSAGECAEERCGGYAGLKCEEGEYCNIAEGQGCGVADASGICREIPKACTREYQPVCGCNDKTYDNECLAAADGQPVRAEGECPPVQ